MISENDYTIMDNEKYPEHHCIRIKTGMYKDVVYAYGRVKAVVEDNEDKNKIKIATKKCLQRFINTSIYKLTMINLIPKKNKTILAK